MAMRRALVSFASSALRAAHAELVDSSSLRCIANSAVHVSSGTPSKHVSPKEKRLSEEDRIGVKSQLYSILKQNRKPLSSAEIWEAAEPLGVKSKRFMKQMLLHMKLARHIKTAKTGKGSQMGYILPEHMQPTGKGVPWPHPLPDVPAAGQEQSSQPKQQQQAA